jgi:uncharacterized phiE125 gp8 family phage protein
MTVNLSRAKEHLRVTHSDEDALITAYLNAAIDTVEQYTSKKLSVGAVTESFSAFGDYLSLRWAPFASLTTIAYTSPDGVASTFSGASAQVDYGQVRVYPPDSGWPSIRDYSNIAVTYQAGFAATPAALDEAVLMLVGQFYDHRTALQGASSDPMVMATVESLCRLYKPLVVA